jgi:hypothetical protein
VPGDAGAPVASAVVAELFDERWAQALTDAAAADPAVGAALAGHALTIAEQIADPGQEPRWHHLVVTPDGRLAVRLGRPAHADVTFTLDSATANAVHAGELDAGQAFVEGRLRVAGDVAGLARHAGALAALAGPWARVQQGEG